MKVYIKEKSGRKFSFWVPMFLAEAALSIADSSFVRSFIPKESLQYMDCIDIKQLKRSLHLLEGYSGLKLVDVRSKDGEEVRITI